jgi:hypothetical protein
MANDITSPVYKYRNLQFHGYAYGNTPVTLHATINGTTVFSGQVATRNEPLPSGPVDDASNVPVLFSIENSTLFPTNWEGYYPMSVSIIGGYGALFTEIYSNYMGNVAHTTTVMENSSIEGNKLTIGTVSSGNVFPGLQLTGTNVEPATFVVWGEGSTWTVSQTQVVPSTTITGSGIIPVTGTEDTYKSCFDGIPYNSEGTPDPRSSVTINGAAQVPPMPASTGVWHWLVPTNHTIAYELNISKGSSS